MKIPQSQAQRLENGSCTVWKYEFGSRHLGFVTAAIRGRYPAGGRVLNEGCDEVYFVQSGSCTVHDHAGPHNLSAGDLFYLPMGSPWWVEAKQVSLVACTAPPWRPEQHRVIDSS